jgi:Fe-S-cluster containining protein
MNHCINCGECCSGLVVVSTEEVNMIKSYCEVHKIRPSNEKWKCQFLTSLNLCKIYPIRPQICKNFTCKVKRTELPKLDLFIKDCFINDIFI